MKLTNRHHSLRQMQASNSAAAPLPQAIALPAISDAASIQLAIAAVLQAAADGTLEAQRARVLLYGLQIAATNARHIVAEKPIERPVVQPSGTATEVVSAEAKREMQSDSINDAAAAETTVIEATAEEKVPQECSIETEEEDGPRATEAQAQQSEDSAQAEQREDAEQAEPSPAPTAAVEEAPQSAAPPVVGYTSSMHSRLLAFRQRSATS